MHAFSCVILYAIWRGSLEAIHLRSPGATAVNYDVKHQRQTYIIIYCLPIKPRLKLQMLNLEIPLHFKLQRIVSCALRSSQFQCPGSWARLDRFTERLETEALRGLQPKNKPLHEYSQFAINEEHVLQDKRKCLFKMIAYLEENGPLLNSSRNVYAQCQEKVIWAIRAMATMSEDDTL